MAGTQPTQSTTLPRLEGKNILVLGGTGQVGSALVAGCLATGARVAVVASEDRLAGLQGRLSDSVASRFIAVPGSTDDLASAQAVRDTVLGKVGKLHGVIAALGGSWSGPQLTEVSFDIWQHMLNEHLTSHFIAAKTFIPAIQASPPGKYILISGPEGDGPKPGSGLLSVVQAAQQMMTRVLASELEGKGVRVEELVYAPSKERGHWLSIEGLLRESLRILAGG